MSKPAFVMFVGVESFSEADESKLPEGVRDVYRDGADEIVIGDVTLECIDEGCCDTADPGGMVGFGIAFYRGWWDSGTVLFNPQEIAAKAAQAQESLEQLFAQWGLEAKPRSLTSCVWIS
jgi:hypothetical protein